MKSTTRRALPILILGLTLAGSSEASPQEVWRCESEVETRSLFKPATPFTISGIKYLKPATGQIWDSSSEEWRDNDFEQDSSVGRILSHENSNFMNVYPEADNSASGWFVSHFDKSSMSGWELRSVVTPQDDGSLDGIQLETVYSGCEVVPSG